MNIELIPDSITWGLLSSIFGVLSGVLTLIIVLAGFFYSKKQFRLLRTSNYIERYNSIEMIEIHNTIDVFIAQTKDLSYEDQKRICYELRTSDDADKIRVKINIQTLLNLLTELGVAYRCGALDPKALDTFDCIVPKYEEKLRAFIEVTQELEAPRKVFNSYLYLVKELKNHRMSNPAPY